MDFMTAKGERNKTAKMTAIALMTAAACVLGPFSIPVPISPVPISLTNLVICFMAYVLGARRGTAACGLYLLLGAVGMPVFGGFSGGLGTLLGPTGGYLIGFLFLAAIAGSFIELFPGMRHDPGNRRFVPVWDGLAGKTAAPWLWSGAYGRGNSVSARGRGENYFGGGCGAEA